MTTNDESGEIKITVGDVTAWVWYAADNGTPTWVAEYIVGDRVVCTSMSVRHPDMPAGETRGREATQIATDYARELAAEAARG